MRFSIALCIVAFAHAASSEPVTVRVMTFNLWHGGSAGGQPLEQSVEVIRAARADLVGLQETRTRDGLSQAPALATALGFHVVDQPDRTAILSRFPVVGASGDLGAVIELPGGRRIHHFNVHYHHAPYQPYQLAGIPYEDGRFITTEAEAISEARLARGEESDQLVAMVQPLIAAGAIVFVTGDFNEPSHLDWTPRAASGRLVPVAVHWPATRALADVGMRDAYRAVHPDESVARGFTWTPTTSPDDPADRHDRIDLVLAGGAITISAAEVVGESPKYADIVVTPFPSDHRAVVAEFVIADDVSTQPR